MSPDFARVLLQIYCRAFGQSSLKEQGWSVTQRPLQGQNEGFTPITTILLVTNGNLFFGVSHPAINSLSVFLPRSTSVKIGCLMQPLPFKREKRTSAPTLSI